MSSPGDFDPYTQACGYQENICNCIEDGLKGIKDALMLIWDAVSEKDEDACKDIEKCIDKIWEVIKKKVEGPQYSCEKCQQMAAFGQSGTIEYAVRCANVVCDECQAICTLADPSSEGKCCRGCGQEPCCCHEGTCVPCPTEEKPGKKWIGWCYPPTGSIAVTKQDERSPGIGWIQVALSDSEQSAATEAAVNCKKVSGPVIKIATEPLSRLAVPSQHCNLGLYSSRQALAAFASGLDSAEFADGIAQLADGLGDLGLGGLTLENFGEIVTGAGKLLFSAPMKFTNQMIHAVSSTIDCSDPSFEPVVQLLMNLGMATRFTGVDFSEFTLRYRYALNASCRQRWLTAEQATLAYLSNAIPYTDFQTLAGMNGVCEPAADMIAFAAKSRPVPLQLSMMRRRELIGSNDYHATMRELGYLDSAVSENLHRLTEQLPTLTDIVQLMVRDADDESIEFWPESDAIFERKYGRQLRQWSEMQGVPEKFAKYAWRAHWSIPSPTQLFEFWHRLRDNPDFGGKDKLLEQIKSALIQQDILPFWHKHYLAVSFNPMGRIDIRRAFNIGAIKDEELVPLYNQIGYSDETSEKLAKFTKRLRDRALLNDPAVKQWIKFSIDRAATEQRLREEGVPDASISKALSQAESAFESSPLAKAFVRGDVTRVQFIERLTAHGVSDTGATRLANQLGFKVTNHPALADYAAGVLERATANSQMIEAGMSATIADNLLKEADRTIDRQSSVVCQRGIKRRYLSGDVDKGDATRLLINYGTTAERANKLSDNWDCEKESRGRSVAAAKLCEWLARGAIDAADFRRRLINLGYEAADAALMVEDCLISISAKRLKETEKQTN